MKNRFRKFFEKIKFLFRKESISEPAVFERKLRKLLVKKISEENMLLKLMDQERLHKLGCDYKEYLFEFTKLFIENKRKILNETVNQIKV